MSQSDCGRVGYVMKMYPRLAETFILNEILAHEAAGLNLSIFSLRSPNDTRFHSDLGRVRAEVTYLPGQSVRTEEFWSAVSWAQAELPHTRDLLDAAEGERAITVFHAIALARAVLSQRIDHLHAHFATAATGVARLAAQWAGISYSFTAHAKDIYHESVDEEDLRRKIRDAAAVVTVSDYNIRHLRRRFGADAARVQLIYNGLDLAEFPYSPPQDREPLIVGVGRLVEKKGFTDLISACAILAGHGKEFRCELIGYGVLTDELAGQICDLGAQNYVKLLGPLSRNEVNAHLRRAAVLAAPCVIASNGNRDGLPTVLLEAMALGIPCVSTDVTGIPEVLRDGETGLNALQHDPENLAGKIQRLLDDEPLSLHVAANARRLIEERFDIHRNTPALRAIFGGARQRRPLVALGGR